MIDHKHRQVDQLVVHEQALRSRRPESLLHFQRVTVQYEDANSPVLSDVSLELREGQSVLFLGPSGCGKSTLAMLCARLIPSSVEAQVTGHLEYHPDLCKPGGIGYVFQDPDAQFCMVHVADEVAFGLENLRVKRKDMPARIRRALTDVELDVDFSATHADFSGGMKQKLSIASALAMSPKLLIFDEPTANLDPHSTRLVFEQLAALHRRGQTMIVIEHKFDPILPFMDVVVLFDRSGTIRRVGPTRDVLQQEWDWLVEAGVVPPWKTKPEWLSGEPDLPDTEQPRRKANPASVPSSVPADSAVSRRTNGEPVLKVSGAAIRYGNKEVWSNVSFVVRKGAFVALVGPNGAGKSSLLQAMAGLQKLSAGEVEVCGRSLRDVAPADRQRILSFCFQNPEYQFIYQTVRDEIANRVTQGQLPEELKQLLQSFGLAGLEEQSPFALSQGQKRRLSVAAMLREDHDIYLLDEPTFGQDARTQQAILDKLVELQQRGKTIVVTTHDMDLVRRYATDVLVLCDGRLAFSGAPEELFANRALLQRAHLLDDVTVLDSSPGKPAVPVQEEREVSASDAWPPRPTTIAGHLNPPLALVGVLLTVVVGVFARTLPETVTLFAWTVFLLWVIPKLTPWQVLKRLSPFLGFYVLYVWTFTAFAATPPGTKTLDILWFHLSWYGLMQGVTLAFRMLSAVALSILMVSSGDITRLIVGLCQTFRLAPKYAYGVLAGLRLGPLFRSEWTKLQQARQLRGRDARFVWLRPVVYALPLLTQAIRLSERVATAMEARGFVGDAASRVEGRTYFRHVPVRWWDYAYLCALPGVALVLLWLV
jgi:energy-coupling factor transporter ATP-binding protein EcfA2/energy-coupling factor transporter transmembrane protein EcfT